MKLTVVFPALNEAAVIERTLQDAVDHLKAQACPYEVIVVDNASTDRTVEVVKSFAARNPAVRLIRHSRNFGYAHSNLTGFRHAAGDIIIVADSDGQHTLADLPLFLEKIDRGAAVVYGWRKVRHDPALRKLISAGLNVVSRAMLEWRLHDINCGFRVVTRPVALSLTQVQPVNYFGPELWVHAVKHGLSVEEVIVSHAERKGGQSIHVPWRLPLTIWRAFCYLLVLRRELLQAAGNLGRVEAP